MSFISWQFFIFLGVLLVLYYLMPKKMQWVLLLLGSTFFYMSAGISYIGFIVFSVLLSWWVGIYSQKSFASQERFLRESPDLSKEDKKDFKNSMQTKRNIIAGFAIALNLLVMIFLKGTVSFKFSEIAVPLGLSFYTLELIGYIFDVSKGRTKAVTNPLRLMLFVSFFPKIIQGPICKFNDVYDRFFLEKSFSCKNIQAGALRISYGLFKKLVIADRLSPAVAYMMSDAKGGYAFLCMIIYSVQLYADFSGGIDIALGVAKLFDITLPENFDTPYFSASLKEFWRRWHISMCEWFKTYVFYPVSTAVWMQKLTKASKRFLGNKNGKKVPMYLGSFIVWSCTGLWHAVGFNYWVWGLCNWAVLMFDEEMEPFLKKISQKYKFLNSKVAHIAFVLKTFLLVTVLNYFDSSDTLKGTFEHFGRFFEKSFLNAEKFSSLLDIKDVAVVVIAVVMVFVISVFEASVKNRQAALKDYTGYYECVVQKMDLWYYVIIAALIFMSVIFGAYGVGYDAANFIYNGF